MDDVRRLSIPIPTLPLLIVSQMYNDPKCKPWTSRNWRPIGYASRHDFVEQTRDAQVNPVKKAMDPTLSEEEKRLEHVPAAEGGVKSVDNVPTQSGEVEKGV